MAFGTGLAVRYGVTTKTNHKIWRSIMTMIRFNPSRLEDTSLVPRTFSQFIDTFFDEALQTKRPFEGTFLPKMNIVENEKSYEIEVLLPGLKKENIKIDLEDRLLTISGERKIEEKQSDARYHLIEAQYGTFSRSVTLPEKVNRETVEATYFEGILKLTIEKDEKSVIRNIQIK
jgi:HSP20 family protein